MKRVVLVVAISALALGGCNWFKSIGKSDNVEPPKALAEFAPSVAVERLWSAGVGNGAGVTGARLTPAFADGRLYAGSVDGTLLAVDATSGRALWSRRDKSLRWSGGPVVQGDLLVAGTLDGEVRAYSAQDGSDRWQARVSSEVITTPAIADGVVAVRTHDGRLYGLDLADGSRKWVYDQSVPALSLRGNAAPLAGNGVFYDGYDSGKVVAVRSSDGAQMWSQTLATGEGRTEVERLSDVDGAMVLDGADLFAVGYRGQLVSIYADNGRPAWTRDLSSYAGVAAGANVVVASAADGNLWAFDRQSGANLWKQDALEHRWLSAPVVQGAYVAVGDLEGYVHWFSLEDGKLAARARLGKDPIEGVPFVVDGTLYVEDTGGRIGAYRLR